MNKILTISVPTYNRSDCLKNLVSELIDAKLTDLVEINIHDNSDRHIQNKNKLFCENVNYYPNSLNLGYEGNVRACIKKATGKYLFIISDDDKYNFDAIGDILDLVSEERLDVLVLNCSLSTDMSVRFNTLLNSFFSNSEMLGDLLGLSDVVTPFNLLPSTIVKTELMKKGESLFFKDSNDYIHSMVLLMGGDCNSKVVFDKSNFLVIYNVPEEIQFNFFKLLSSKEKITRILRDKFNIKRTQGLEVLEMSKWCFMGGVDQMESPFKLHHVLYFSYKSLLVLRFLPLMYCWLGLLPAHSKRMLYKLYSKLKAVSKRK
jgi:glycosyltransferase involved in cell wall biosynthesis